MPTYAGVVSDLRAAGCVFAEDEATLLLDAAADERELSSLVARRCAGEPLEQVVGWAAFAGLRIIVEPGVFVPRRRTELLARQAAELAGPSAVVVDLCCGTGAVAAFVQAAVPGVEVYAADADAAAVACARRNLGEQVYLGDLYDALPPRLRGRVDVLVANAPYVPTTEVARMPAEARDREPRVTLDGGPDGLDVVRRLVEGAPLWLASGGHLLFEVARRQAGDARAVCREAGFVPRVLHDDCVDGTVVSATRAWGSCSNDRRASSLPRS